MGLLRAIGDLKWGTWLYTLLGAGISAAATTLAANPLAAVLGAQIFSPRQLAILAGSSAIVAMAGILKKSPLPDRRIDIALLSTVNTRADVALVAKNTEPGTIPSAAVAADIIQDNRTGGGNP